MNYKTNTIKKYNYYRTIDLLFGYSYSFFVIVVFFFGKNSLLAIISVAIAIKNAVNDYYY